MSEYGGVGVGGGLGAGGAPVPVPPGAGSGDAADRKPEEPSLSAREWVRHNLFSSPFNSALTVVFGLLILLVARGLLNFSFSEEREWDAVRTNLRLIFTHAYPEEQYIRIWFCVGTVLVLAGLSMGLFAGRGRGVSMKKLASSLMGTAALWLWRLCCASRRRSPTPRARRCATTTASSGSRSPPPWPTAGGGGCWPRCSSAPVWRSGTSSATSADATRSFRWWTSPWCCWACSWARPGCTRSGTSRSRTGSSSPSRAGRWP